MGDLKLDTFPFVQIDQPDVLIPILKTRLPKSGQVYNSVLMYPKFKNQVKIYIFNPELDANEFEISANIWIIVVYKRKDISQDVTICTPEEIKITPEIKEAFTNSSMFNWEETFSFKSLDRYISLFLCELILMKGLNSKLIPCHYFYCSEEDALALDISHGDEVDLKPLDLTTGPDFIYNSWTYSRDGSMEYITESIERNISSGVFNKEDGKPISGMLTIFCGFMGMLYTDKAFRNKNYGKLCMQYLIQQLAINDFIPCSIVEIHNQPSKNFHRKVGMKYFGFIDVIKIEDYRMHW